MLPQELPQRVRVAKVGFAVNPVDFDTAHKQWRLKQRVGGLGEPQGPLGVLREETRAEGQQVLLQHRLVLHTDVLTELVHAARANEGSRNARGDLNPKTSHVGLGDGGGGGRVAGGKLGARVI